MLVWIMAVSALVGQTAKPESPKPGDQAIPPEIAEFFAREQQGTAEKRAELEKRITDLDAKLEAESKPSAKAEIRKQQADARKFLNRLETRDVVIRPDMTRKGSIGWIPEAEIKTFLDDSTAAMMGHETQFCIYVLQDVSPKELKVGKKPDFKHPWQVVEVEQKIHQSPKWNNLRITRGLTPNSGTFCVVKPILRRDLERYRELAKGSEKTE